jgi:glutathione S-transferase
MADMTLVIASKNYSLWPLPAWLCMRTARLDFEEVVIPFDEADTTKRMLKYGPTGRVPVLKHGDRTIWDSLAICEYVNELVPSARLWPEDAEARAVARSVVAELHSGGGRFIAYTLDTNVRRRTKRVTLTEVNPRLAERAITDFDRVMEIWRDCRARFGSGGPFLFGHFTIADAMHAHLVNRFVTYDIELPADCQNYRDAMRAYPPHVEWIAAAEEEESTLESVDNLFTD